MTTQQEAINLAREALELASAVFRDYAALHSKKENTPENRVKVQRNLDYGNVCNKALAALDAVKEPEVVGVIEHDADIDRYYIPVHPKWEIQTKGKGSSFRIANTETGNRMLVADRYLHKFLEDMARDINALYKAPPSEAK